MKLNKYLIIVFMSSCFLSNICLSINEENNLVEKIVHKREEAVAEKKEEKKIEKIEKPLHQEHVDEILTRSNSSDLPRENSNQEQPIQETVEKPKKVQKKVQKKKVENPKPEEQSSSESDAGSNNQSTGVDLSNTDSSPVEVQEFRSKSPQQPDRNSKEYVIRGLASMILVIIGAILLVIVIITGVNNKKRKR